MSLYEKAKEVLDRYPLTDELVEKGKSQFTFFNGAETLYVNAPHIQTDDEYFNNGLTKEILWDSFDWYIDLTEKSVSDEVKIPLGTSKIKGIPHLPKDFEWPEGYLFHAQFNMADVSKEDRIDLFPQTGMLYIFLNPDWDDECDGYGCKVIYKDVAPEELHYATYPAKESFSEYIQKYYYEDFAGNYAELAIRSEFCFAIDDGLERKYLQPELISSIEEKIDSRFGESSDFALIGRPSYWQGEDEFGGDMYEDPAMLEVMLAEGMIDQEEFEEYMETAKDKSADLFLFQDEFGEGHIHYWIERDAFKKNDFSKSRTSYSGT